MSSGQPMSRGQQSGIAGMSADPDEMQRRIDQWAQSFADKAERYRTVQQKTEEIRLSATNANGAVRVTVRADGSIDDLQFTEKIRSMSLTELSSQVLATMRQAQSNIADRVGEVMTETLGDEDGETRSMMLGNLRERFPQQEEAQEEPGEQLAAEEEAEAAEPAPEPKNAPEPPAAKGPTRPTRPAPKDDPDDEDNDDVDLLADE